MSPGGRPVHDAHAAANNLAEAATVVAVPGGTSGPGSLNRPSASVFTATRAGSLPPAGRTNTLAPATGLPSGSSTRPETVGASAVAAGGSAGLAVAGVGCAWAS